MRGGERISGTRFFGQQCGGGNIAVHPGADAGHLDGRDPPSLSHSAGWHGFQLETQR
jgi:hypothetical protein